MLCHLGHLPLSWIPSPPHLPKGITCALGHGISCQINVKALTVFSLSFLIWQTSRVSPAGMHTCICQPCVLCAVAQRLRPVDLGSGRAVPSFWRADPFMGRETGLDLGQRTRKQALLLTSCIASSEFSSHLFIQLIFI